MDTHSITLHAPIRSKTAPGNRNHQESHWHFPISDAIINDSFRFDTIGRAMVLSNSLTHTFRIWMTFLPIGALAGCTGYAVSLNDNPIYNPPTLFSDYQIADSALQECVQQSIEDQSVTEASG